MTEGRKQFSIRAACMAAGLATAFAAVGASGAAQREGPLACDIVARSSGGSIALESVALAGEGLSGSYSFKVRGPGTSISQGGPFEAAAGEAVTLSQVMVSNGRSYDVELEVSAGGVTAICSDTVG